MARAPRNGRHVARCHRNRTGDLLPDRSGRSPCGRRNVPQVSHTPVVIDHLARIGGTNPIRDEEVSQLCALASHPRVSVKVSTFYALGEKKPPYLDLAEMIRRVFEAYGPERLMWASDCPYQLGTGHTYEDSISLVRDRLDFVGDGDREWLLRKTAERVYFFV